MNIMDFSSLKQAVITGFILLVGNSALSYFKKKGENQATKDDIEEITEKIESIKQLFISDNEILKSKLSVFTNLQTGFANEEKNCILDLHEKFYKWIVLSTDLSFGNVDFTNSQNLDSYLKSLSDTLNDVLISEGRLHLYISDLKFLEQAVKIRDMTFKVDKIMESFISSLKYLNFELKEIESKNSSTRTLEAKGKYNKDVNLLKKEARDKILDNMKIIDPEIKLFQENCRVHIRILIGN